MILRQMLNPPNWFTSASLLCGLYAILLAGAADGDAREFYRAGLMIFFAGLFDALDGRVARLTGTGSAFGAQLDSLVDIASFGVAPACLVYFWGFQPYGALGVGVAGLLMLAGAFRLARFNVAPPRSRRWSEGLTITMGGGTVAAVVMYFAGSGHVVPKQPLALAALVVAVSVLEVSSVPYRALKGLRPRALAAMVVLGAACAAVGAFYDISAALVALGGAHLVSGPVELLWRAVRRRPKLVEDDQVEPAERAGPA